MILLMGVHVLPRFESYWSRDSLLGIPSLSRCMSRARFRQLLRHLHLYDEASCDDAAKEDRFYKVRPIVRTLQKTFLLGYNPSQEFSVDEMMIKCKGRAKGKVYQPYGQRAISGYFIYTTPTLSAFVIRFASASWSSA